MQDMVWVAPGSKPPVVPADAGTHTPCRPCSGIEADAFFPDYCQGLWVPADAGTTKHTSAFPRQLFARALPIPFASLKRGRTRPSREGAGKTGCALHPRSHVQTCIKKMRT
jgi:hypothetical protein